MPPPSPPDRRARRILPVRPRKALAVDLAARSLRRAHLITLACLVTALWCCAGAVLNNIARHERSLSLTAHLSELAQQSAGKPGARPDFSRGTLSAIRSLSSQARSAIAEDRKDDAATERALVFWLGAVVVLVLVEGHLLSRLLIAPIRQSVSADRRLAEQERERRVVEARERELRIRNRELERLAGTDSLTGLPNRRALVTWLRREVDRLGRSAIPLGVLMIDIDHFKNLNDAFGHAMGDEALRLVGRTIQRNVRSSDLAARYGGEEFVVLLPGANEVDTAEVAEVVREAIADADWHSGELRVSVGAVSAIPEFDGDSLVRAADRALYEAKRSGRNRTVVATLTAKPTAPSTPRN